MSTYALERRRPDDGWERLQGYSIGEASAAEIDEANARLQERGGFFRLVPADSSPSLVSSPYPAQAFTA